MSKGGDFEGPSAPAQQRNEEFEWEVRPGGMLVQRREDEDGDGGGASSRGPMIKINVSNGTVQHEVFAPAQSTFGTPLLTLSVSLSLFFWARNLQFRCQCRLYEVVREQSSFGLALVFPFPEILASLCSCYVKAVLFLIWVLKLHGHTSFALCLCVC